MLPSTRFSGIFRTKLQRTEHGLLPGKNVLLPGPGHVEINVIRVLFQLLWPLGMEDLAKILWFKTPMALSFARQRANHHKAWEMLIIYFKALLTFTLVPNRDGCQSKGILVTLRGAEELVQCRAAPSLTLAVTICLHYVLGLIVPQMHQV